jgi:alpha-ketoglutarate-dependent taurine dioxygenase
MNKPQVSSKVSVPYLRDQLDLQGYVVADVGDRDNYLALCNQLGSITQTREIHLIPREQVEKYTGYSHLPEEVPFHTDYPLVNVVGLFCEHSDNEGGENLLVDSREILKALSSTEKESLKNVQVPLPRSNDSLPILTELEGQSPHIYWLPVFTLSNLDKLDDSKAAAVKRFNEVLLSHRQRRRYLSIKLSRGQALWFDNFVMLHGRDKLKESSKRFQVRAFIKYV